MEANPDWQDTVKAGTKVTTRIIDDKNRGRRIEVSINGKDFVEADHIIRAIDIATWELVK